MNQHKLYQRRKKNCIRRWERRRSMFLLLATLFLVITLSFGISGFLSNAKSPSDAVTYKYYKSISIAQGETLWSIAGDYRNPEKQSVLEYVDEVKKINALQEDNIEAGKYIIIPYYSN